MEVCNICMATVIHFKGLSQTLLAQLQQVQNAIVRLLTGAKKQQHISPILASLHCLLVHFRSYF